MRRLSARPGLIASMLVLATAAWWLGRIALELGSGSANLNLPGAQAATVLITAQWLLIAFLTTTIAANSKTGPLELLATSLPLWPLLALLWLTSKLSIFALIASQLVALLLATALALVGKTIAANVRDADFRHLASVAVGVVCATIIWLARAPLTHWITS